MVLNLGINIMKPKKTKNSSPDLSQTQAQALEGASGSQENPSTSTEQTARKSKRKLPFSRKTLKDIIAGLEDDLADGSWLKDSANHPYEEMDSQLMPALVKQANHKYPDLSLEFFTSPEDFTNALKEAITRGLESSRTILSADYGITHFAIVDHRTIDHQTSLILFDPTQFDHVVSHMLAKNLKKAIQEDQLPNCHFAMAEMGIQRSPSEDGILSLALAKKFHTHAEQVTRMHQDNINGILCEPDCIVSPSKVDQYLPAKFYKHTQSRERLEKYIKANPEAAKQPVNKKQQTLSERFEQNLAELDGQKSSVSAHKKRVNEYKALIR